MYHINSIQFQSFMLIFAVITVLISSSSNFIHDADAVDIVTNNGIISQNERYGLNDYAKFSSMDLEIWSPDVLLVGYEYDLMILQNKHNTEPLVLDIFTNNENVIKVLESKVTIDSFKGHGIFKIKAVSPGKAEIISVADGEIVKKSILVQESSFIATQLDLVLPSDTVKIKHMPAFVVLKDASGNPISAYHDAEISLSSFGNVDVEESKVIIKKGSHYASFNVEINGDGGISASAPDIIPDTKKIKAVKNNIDPKLNLRVAPNPLGAHSSGEVYVWMEQNGKPFIPSEDVKITLVSENEDFLTFSKSLAFNRNPTTKALDSSTTFFIKAGSSYAKTKVWTTDFISEFNPQFGIQPSHLELEPDQGVDVGITALGDGMKGVETDVRIRLIQTIDSDTFDKMTNMKVMPDPTITKIWAYPDPAFDNFEVIVAAYMDDEDIDESIDDKDTQNSDTIIQSLGISILNNLDTLNNLINEGHGLVDGALLDNDIKDELHDLLDEKDFAEITVRIKKSDVADNNFIVDMTDVVNDLNDVNKKLNNLLSADAIKAINTSLEDDTEDESSDDDVINEVNVDDNLKIVGDGNNQEDDLFGRNVMEDDRDDEIQDNICKDCVPLIIAETDLKAHISTNNLVKASSSEDILISSLFTSKSNYAVFTAQTTGLLGDALISGVVDGTTGDNLEIKIEQPYLTEPQLGIKSLPVISNEEQVLFLIYIHENGAIKNEEIINLTVNLDANTEITQIEDHGSIKVVSGIVHSTISDDVINVSALANNFENTLGEISVFDHVASDMVVVHPSKVRSNELFPVVMYTVDQQNQPVEMISATISSDNIVQHQDNGLVKLSENTDTNFIVYKQGLDPINSKVEVFGSSLSGKIDVSKIASIEEVFGDTLSISNSGTTHDPLQNQLFLLVIILTGSGITGLVIFQKARTNGNNEGENPIKKKYPGHSLLSQGKFKKKSDDFKEEDLTF